MKRAALASLLAALGCIRQPAPGNPAPQVQPEAHAAHDPHATNAPLAAPLSPANAAAPASHFGTALTVTQPTALAAIVATPQQYNGQTVRVDGTVAAVCQARGCWMQLTDADQRVHIRMHGHSFFIPRNAAGHRARVQGTVIAANAEGHCESEAAEQTGQQVARLELDATGVELD